MRQILTQNQLFEISLKAIIKNNRGEILILKCRDNGKLAGYYDIPGGRIQTGEVGMALEKILKREIVEEVGDIQLEINPRIVTYGWHDRPDKIDGQRELIWFFFEAEYLGGEIKISSEHSDWKWQKLDKNNLEKFFIRGPLDGMRNYFQDNK